MDSHDYYYGLIVQENHLDDSYGWAEAADRHQNSDAGVVGITIPGYDVGAAPPTPPEFLVPASWTPRENAPPDWKVLVSTGYAYDKDGKRMAVDPPTTVLLDCQNDYLGVPNSVPLNFERWISIFLMATKVLSDPQVDDNGVTVYFMETETYELQVEQGPAEAAPPGAVTRPAIRSDDILIADILIDNGMPPINNADMHFDRTEFLVRLDASPILGAGAMVRGRNLEEALYFLIAEMVSTEPFDLAYLRLDGTNQMAGNIEPDTDAAYTLGLVNRWNALITHTVNEFMEYGAGSSYRAAQADHDGPAKGHGGLVFRIMEITERGVAGTVMQYDDVMGRRHRRYTEDREDFLYPFGWPGTPGTETDWQLTLTAGGLYVMNPVPYSQSLAGGFIQFTTPVGADAVQLWRGAYPLRADLDTWTEFGILVVAVGANMFFSIGVKSAVSNWFSWIYDPTALDPGHPGAPNANLWCVYDDGGANPPLWVDSGIAFATLIGNYARLGVAFERRLDGATPLMARWYLDEQLEQEQDLTALGGTYEAAALAQSFDLILNFDENGGAGLGDLLVDYYENIQRRET